MKPVITYPYLWSLVAAALVGCGPPSVSESQAPPSQASALAIGAAHSAADNPANASKSTYRPRRVDPPIQISDADREGHARMLRELGAMRKRETKSNAYYGTARVEQARQALAKAQTDEARFLLGVRLMYQELNQGNYPAVMAQMVAARQLFERNKQRIAPTMLAETYAYMGVAHLRHAETENCCLMRNKDSCLLPIRDGGVHTRQDSSRAAVADFQRVAELAAPDSELYFEAMWLWNITSMTLGEYPAGVPEQYRIPPERFESREPFPRLMNIAGDLGIDAESMCGSVVADDFNNDGYLDLLVSTWDVRESLKYFVNDGAGGFDERTSAAGLDGVAGGLNMIQGDYNNDGRIDVYIFRGAWQFEAGRNVGSLLRNNGDGTFTDVTFPAGLANESYPSQSGGWADYDLDGWLDLFVAGEQGPNNVAPCRLFHNNRDGTFTDVAREAGVATNRLIKGCTWGDYDNDRDPDLYLSNLGGAAVVGGTFQGAQGAAPNLLYRNNGDGTFTDVARQAGVTAEENSTFGTWFWDYNNDGLLDLYVAAYDSSLGQIARYYLGERMESGMPRVFRGTPQGRFVEVTREMDLHEPTNPMGSNFGDLDNDGWLDMYLGTGSPTFQMIIPNKLYHNIGGERFSDVSEAAGMAHLQKGHGAAFADLDADGDQDVFMQMGGALPVDAYADLLFENPGFGNNSVAVELVGVESNRFGVGSRIRVDVEQDGQTRSIYRWINSGGSFGCNPTRQQIGVGKAMRVPRLEVYWPTSDETQVFEDLPVNGILRVTEGADSVERVELAATEFARPRPAKPAH